MASEGTIRKLEKAVGELDSVDLEQLLRPSLGAESLAQHGFAPVWDKVRSVAQFILEYAEDVPDGVLDTAVNTVRRLQNLATAQAGRSPADYISNREAFVNGIRTALDELSNVRPHFVSAAIMARGFLEDEGIKKAYDHALEQIRQESQRTLQEVRKAAHESIEEARKLAKEIEVQARRTAQGISVEAAQKQFRDAQVDLRKKVVLWAALSVLSLLTVLGTMYWFSRSALPEHWTWQFIYYSTLRLAWLGTLGAVTAFCFQMLRAHLHLSEHNLHRQRVANSIEAFVQSAMTPEQRDMILAQLVDSVVKFGNSGLLPADHEGTDISKVTIESIARSFISPPQNR